MIIRESFEKFKICFAKYLRKFREKQKKYSRKIRENFAKIKKIISRKFRENFEKTKIAKNKNECTRIFLLSQRNEERTTRVFRHQEPASFDRGETTRETS